MALLPVAEHPLLLAGTRNAEDAAVYKIDDERALIATIDFFTPIVDEPYDYGRIAAINALSDIYAMGGEPFLALNVVAFPYGKLEDDVLINVLKGGAATCAAEGVLLGGGHTVKSPDILYGLAAMGFARPDRIVTNGAAKAGDALVLTKALGTGVVQTAQKQGDCPPETEAAALESMLLSNRAAAAAMVAAGAVCATDVTGFGLLGHALEMATASSVGVRIFASKVPRLPQALEFAATHVPGGLKTNREFVEPKIKLAAGVDDAMVNLLADPQTSGGLLVALPPERAEAYAAEVGGAASVVGEVFASPSPLLEITA
jgi:selenide,water dikinase